jgi:hypothetical protein
MGRSAHAVDASSGFPPAKEKGGLERSVGMSKNLYMGIFFLLMVGSIVGVDALFLRKHFGARLLVNIGIVIVFAGFYFIFLKDL